MCRFLEHELGLTQGESGHVHRPTSGNSTSPSELDQEAERDPIEVPRVHTALAHLVDHPEPVVGEQAELEDVIGLDAELDLRGVRQFVEDVVRRVLNMMSRLIVQPVGSMITPRTPTETSTCRVISGKSNSRSVGSG